MPVPSQALTVKYKNAPFRVDLDSGATVSFIREDIAMKLKLSIHHNGQLALLADKKTQMRSLGEIDITVLETSTQNIILRLRALVVSNLGVECYGGQTFHLDNGIVDNICTRTISLHHGKFVLKQPAVHLPIAHPPPYLSITEKDAHLNAATICLPLNPPPAVVHGEDGPCSGAAIRPSQRWNEQDSLSARTKTIAIKKPRYLLPSGEYELNLGHQPENNHILIMPEPPIINQTSQVDSPPWPPQICQVSGCNGQYINFSADKSLHHPNNVHFRAIQVKEIPFGEALAAGDDRQELSPSINLGSASLSIPSEILSNLKINRSIMSPAQNKRLDGMIIENIRAFDEDLSGNILLQTGE